MRPFDRFLIGTVTVGVWTLIALQLTSNTLTHAQEASVAEQVQEDRDTQGEDTVIYASEIVGLGALIDSTVRDRHFRPQSMPGLDLYVKSIVRNCRVSATISGDRVSSANISC